MHLHPDMIYLFQGDGSCVWPARPCDGDGCVGQQQMCDATADCDDGTDGLYAFCTKRYVVVSNRALASAPYSVKGSLLSGTTFVH